MENSFEKLNFKLEVFEGPLDLLLHLIEKNKVNIYDIPIAEITDQYMAYLDEMKRRDLDIMSEFLVMASTLLSIKAKMLLPKQETADEEESEDPSRSLSTSSSNTRWSRKFQRNFARWRRMPTRFSTRHLRFQTR